MSSEKIKFMIGQMIMVGFRGLNATKNNDIIRDIYDLNMGGLILFDYDLETNSCSRNIKTKDQVKRLVKAVNSFARTPLFITIDQEGGDTVRLKPEHGYKKTYNAADIGRLNDPHIARASARTIAMQLAESGINVNFAPVVDLSVNNENKVIVKSGRSISDNPDKVIRYAKTFIHEHSKMSIATCIKHFMGHGSSTDDSHKGFVDVTESYVEDEKVPFYSLIQKGVVDMVMTAHVFNRHYDTTYPFTLSENVITGILRNEMGFNGIVISDDIQMKAITSNYSFKESVIKAVKAGVDIVLIGNNLTYDQSAHKKAISSIYESVKSGILTEERIKASFDRIMELKKKIGICL